VLDAITLERRGIPAAMVGAEKLVNTTGRGMAKLQGLPDFPLAIIAGHGLLEAIRTDEERREVANDVAVQVANILLHGRTR
jgi:hypothetical protein